MVTLDLRGEVCPYTFIKTQLALEQLLAGATLAVLVNHAPATRSVPRACREAGHEVEGVREVSTGSWEIVVRKRTLTPPPRPGNLTR
jgi:TusA-related sulfurtransferase